MQETMDTLHAVLRSEDEGTPSTPKQSTTPALDSLIRFLNHPQRREQIREIEQGKLGHIHALEMNESLLEAAKDALSHALQIDFESADDGLIG